jgi:predicted permease
MIRTVIAMRQVDPGFVRPGEVLTLRISIPSALVADPVQTARTHEQIMRRLEQVPGVMAVGLGSNVPMDGNRSIDPVFMEDFPSPEGQMPPMRRYKFVAPGFFRAMGARLLAGRDVSWQDLAVQAPVVVISENFAREYWKTPAAAIGKRVRQTPEHHWLEIIGVVSNDRQDGLSQPSPTTVYWPMLMKNFWLQPLFVARTMTYAIRTSRPNSPTLLEDVQRAVWSVNANLPLANVRMLDDLVAQSMAQTAFALVMLAIAGGVALLLGLVGIYGVVAYIAAQRTREIGIRMALGAQPQDVRRLFVRHGLVLTGIGIVIGLAGAGFVTRFMASLLFGVEALDAMTYASVAGGLAVVALLASYIPAWRASRLDPAAALRV